MNPNDFAIGTPWAISPRHLDNLIVNYTEFLKSPLDSVQALSINFSDDKNDPGYVVDNGVAIIPISGPISKSRGIFSFLFGGTSYGEIATALMNAMIDKDVGAIVFDIDSPGGTVAGVEAVGDLIFDNRDEKPIISFANGMMASAAYWLGSAAETIVGTKTSEVGSIGVLMIHEDQSKMDKEMGLKITYLTAGKYKALGNPHEPLGDTAKAIFMDELNEIYTVFVDTVARNRDIEFETVLTSQADGRVFIGQQSKDRGMIDEIGSLGLAVDLARSSIDNKNSLLGGITMKNEIKTIEDLSTAYPGLVDQIIADAKALVDVEAATKEARSTERVRVLGLVETFLGGPEKAAPFKAVVESDVTVEQFAAISGLQTSNSDNGDDGPVTRKMMFDAIKEAGAENPGPAGAGDGDKDYLVLVEAHMKSEGVSKAMAMRAITAKYPEKHEEYIRKANAAK